MKQIKKRYLFFVLVSLLFWTNYSPVTVYGDGSVTTNGVIRLYSDELSSDSSTEDTHSSNITTDTKTPVTKKSGNGKKLPSTGEVIKSNLWLIGIGILLLLSVLFFYQKRRKEGMKDEN